MFPHRNITRLVKCVCAAAFATCLEAARAEEPVEIPVAPVPATEPTQAASPWSDRFFDNSLALHSAPSTLGLDWSVTYIGEVLGNLSGGFRQRAVYEGLVKAMVDFDCEKGFGWRGARLHASGLFPHGESLSCKSVGDLFILSNIDAPESVRLFELWLQQELFNNKLSLRAGQLAADEEFAGTDYGGLFIDSTYGWPSIIALNTCSPSYPCATPGLRLRWDPDENWFLQAGLYNGEPNPVDENGNGTNPHGTAFSLHHGFIAVAEANRCWSLARSKRGNAKLGGWWHSGNCDGAFEQDEEHFLSHSPRGFVSRNLDGNWGLYLAAQQQLWLAQAATVECPRGLRGFVRVGGSPPERNLMEFYAEGGFTYLGLVPGREQDECGAAVAYGQLSDELRNQVRIERRLCGNYHPLPDYEAVVSVSYRFAVRAGWSLQPFGEYVIHPVGARNGTDALVAGLRTTVSF
jgi:porin